MSSDECIICEDHIENEHCVCDKKECLLEYIEILSDALDFQNGL